MSAELPKGYVPTLKKVYREEIVDKLVKQFSYTTVMQVPRLVKITINEGVGDGTQDKKLVEESAAELSKIVGQKAVLTTSKKDVSNFKLRKGMPIGVKVTLRDVRMYEFLERLIRISRVSATSTVLPRSSTAVATTPLVSRSRSSSRRSISTRTRGSMVLRLPLSLRRRPMRRLMPS